MVFTLILTIHSWFSVLWIPGRSLGIPIFPKAFGYLGLLHAIEGLLEDLPIFEASNFLFHLGDQRCFIGVFGGAVFAVEDSKIAGKGIVRQTISRVFVCDVVVGGNFFEVAALARVGGVEGAGIEFDAFAEAFDDAESVVVHCFVHHAEEVFGVCAGCSGDEAGAAGYQLFHRIDGLVFGAGSVGFAFEADGRGGRGLFFGEAVDEVVHDDVGHFDVFAGGVVDVVAADGKGVAVAAKDENMQVRARKRDAGCKGKRPSVDVVHSVRLDEVGKAAGTTDAGDCGDFFVPDFSLFNQFEVKGEDGKIAASRTPSRMVGGEFFLFERLSIRIRQGRNRNGEVSVSFKNGGRFCTHDSGKGWEALGCRLSNDSVRLKISLTL